MPWSSSVMEYKLLELKYSNDVQDNKIMVYGFVDFVLLM